MNSDLFFGKKKYISTQKASSTTGYSQDYIGQLAREKQIDSKRIGRVWYVKEESILKYSNLSKLESSSWSKIGKLASFAFGLLLVVGILGISDVRSLNSAKNISAVPGNLLSALSSSELIDSFKNYVAPDLSDLEEPPVPLSVTSTFLNSAFQNYISETPPTVATGSIDSPQADTPTPTPTPTPFSISSSTLLSAWRNYVSSPVEDIPSPVVTDSTNSPQANYQGPRGPQGPVGPTGPQGPIGPQGPSGKDADTSLFVLKDFFDTQVDRIFNSISSSVQGLANTLAQSIITKLLDVTDTFTVGGGYGSTGLTISSSGNIEANGTLTIDGASTLTGALTVGTINGQTISSTANFTGTVNITTSATSPIFNATSALQLNGTNINTGGTLTNVAYLDQANIFSLNNIFSTSITTPLVTASGALALTPAAGSNLNINLSTTGDFAVNTDDLYVDTSAGNVGIGTVSPSTAKLVVQSDWDSGATNNTQLYLQGNTDTNKQLRIGFDTTSNFGYIQALISGTGTNNLALNPSGGNVGIGTTDPQSLLHLAGGSALINNTSANARVHITTTTSGNPILALTTNGQQDWSVGVDRSASGTFKISSDGLLGAPKLTIDTTGNISAADLAGTGNRCIYADSTGQINVKGFDCGSASGGDNLGDHTATQNIIMGSNYLSGDGGAEGLTIDTLGQVTFSNTNSQLFIANANTTHGITAWQPANVGARFGTGDTGGMFLSGISDDLAAVGLSFYGVIGSTDPTDSVPAIMFAGAKQNGTIPGPLGNAETVFQLRNFSTNLLTVLGNGNVGIGTAGPGYKLELSDSSINGTKLALTNTDTGGGSWQMISTGSNNSGGAGNLLFYNGTNVGVYMKSDGNVGIGTTGPSGKLHVEGGGIVIQSVESDSVFDGGYSTRTAIIGKDGYWAMRSGTDHSFNLDVYNSNAEKAALTVLQSGNVGIGTTGPENMLHIAKSNAGGIGASIYLDNPSASTLLNENQIAFGGDSGASFAGVSGARLRAITRNASSGATSFQIDTWDGAAEAARLYIKEDGNVGIGTTGPGALLHVQKAADTTSLEALRLDNPDPNQRSSTSVYMSMFAGAERARILAGNPNDFSSGEGFLAFYTRTSSALQERMRISNTGNVGIGTTDPSAQKLVVAGNVRVGTGTTGCVEDADGTVIAGTCSSDLRLKKDIVSLSGADMLGKFTALNPVSYTWRADEYPEKQLGTEIQYGLIAQEVEALFPELVKTDDKGFKQINFSVLPIYSIQAVKELNLNLNATAGTITPLAGSAQESFATSFFSNLFTKITAWLSDAGNGIAKIFAKEVHTDLICVSDENGKTCITRQDLVDMLTANGQNSNSDTTTTETTDTTTDTTTEETTTEDTSTTDTTDTTTDTTDTSTTEDTTTTEETTTETTDTTTDTSTTDTTTSEPTPAE